MVERSVCSCRSQPAPCATLTLVAMPAVIKNVPVLWDTDTDAEPWVPDLELADGKTFVKLTITPQLKRYVGCNKSTNGLGSAPFWGWIKQLRSDACEACAIHIKERQNDPFAQATDAKRKILLSLTADETPKSVWVTIPDHPEGGANMVFATQTRLAVSIEFTEANFTYIKQRLVSDLEQGWDRPKRAVKRALSDECDTGPKLKYNDSRSSYYWYGVDAEGRRLLRSFVVAKSADEGVQEALHTAARNIAKTEWEKHIQTVARNHAALHDDSIEHEVPEAVEALEDDHAEPSQRG
jgi:hypothetical protein